MSTAVAVIPTQLPAFLQTPEAIAAAERFNASVSGGITAGGFPQLTLGGGKFHIEDSSVEPHKQLVTYDQGGVAVPAMQLETVIVGGNPYISKVFYLKEWQEGDNAEPDCSSDNSITPDAHIANPQSAACATCRQNEWGSKINKQSGKEVKACGDSKRLVILSVHDLNFKALGLKIPAASLKEFGAYVRTLDRPGISIPLNAVVTRLMFDPSVTYPKLKFSFVRVLTEAEYAKVIERSSSEEVKRIETPARAARPLPQLAAPQPAPQLAAPAPAAPQPAPVAPPPPPVAAPQPAPVAPPPAALAAPPAPTFAPAPPPVAEAPSAPAYPPHVVAAVEASGGFESENGKKVLYALMPELAPAPEKRTRAKKADTPPAAGPGAQFAPPPPIAAAPAAPSFVAPAPPVAEAPTAPVPSFASAPAANTVQPGSSQADALTAMLADILKK